MKRIFIMVVALAATYLSFSQAVQRSYVVLEIGTGTWCTYCPGAANGAHDLLANGKKVAVIENHNGDPFANTASNARNTYYGISGYPTANFDGGYTHVGGAACPTGNVYSSYLDKYNQAYAVLSPLKIDISGTNTGNTYNITICMHKVAAITATDLKLHLVLTESDIATAPWPGSSGCMTQVDHVTRLFVPSHEGTAVSFTNGDFQVINLTFQKDATWVASNCELVAFVQSQGGKTIYNGMKVALTALPLPMSVNFTGTPTTGCAPVITNYNGIAAGATQWQWNFPGGNPSSSNVQNPSVTYNTAGTWDVTLTAWDAATGRGNIKTVSGFVSLDAAPVAPGTPQGTANMCSNPANATYSISSVAGAQSYTWDLSPASAGVLYPSGTSCTVDFDDAWAGNAQLKVRGSNACGDGAWSSPLNIAVSEQPGQPGIPAGPQQLCMNAANSEYTTSGTNPVTSYTWELLPYEAGAIYPNWTSCTIDWVDTYSGPATLKVKAINGSCEGIWSEVLNIVVNPGPSAFNMTGGGVYCGQGGSGSPVGLDDSETGINYTLYLNAAPTPTVIPGTGNAITFGNQTAAGTYTALAVNSSAGCSNSMSGSVPVSIDPEPPHTPGQPSGPGQVYTGATPATDYETTGGLYATTYNWTLTPSESGEINGTGTQASVVWNAAFAGTVEIKVQGVNSCGGGSYSTSFEVQVDMGVGINDAPEIPALYLYPNPARNVVTLVSGISESATLEIHDIHGRILKKWQNVSLSSQSDFDLSGLNPGVYIVKIQYGQKMESLRLVIR